jgi:hypothetical protein
MPPDDSIPLDTGPECHKRLGAAVFRMPSVFGRLVAVSELRSRTTGRYQHQLACEFGEPLVDATLQRMHREVFATWLQLKVQEQERDLLIWLSWLDLGPQERAKLLHVVAEGLDSLLPPQYIEVERRLFVSDLHLVLSLISQPSI